MKHIEVVAAAIVHNHSLLATRRGYGPWSGWWEFPGGKVEPGEAHTDALRRELLEELALDVQIDRQVGTIDYDYPEFHLTMHLYLCRPLGTPTLLEHSAASWLHADELDSVQWLPADLAILDKIKQLLEIW